MAKSMDIKEKFIKLRASEESYEKIAKKLGISKPTAISWGKDFSKEIANLKAARFEVLMERYILTIEDKVKMWGELVNNINDSLITRNFYMVESDKLLDMLCKAQAKLESSFVEPVFENIDDNSDAQE